MRIKGFFLGFANGANRSRLMIHRGLYLKDLIFLLVSYGRTPVN